MVIKFIMSNKYLNLFLNFVILKISHIIYSVLRVYSLKHYSGFIKKTSIFSVNILKPLQILLQPQNSSIEDNHYGIRGTPYELFKSYLKNRQQLITVNSELSKL